jgi:hypothetical protein
VKLPIPLFGWLRIRNWNSNPIPIGIGYTCPFSSPKLSPTPLYCLAFIPRRTRPQRGGRLRRAVSSSAPPMHLTPMRRPHPLCRFFPDGPLLFFPGALFSSSLAALFGSSSWPATSAPSSPWPVRPCRGPPRSAHHGRGSSSPMAMAAEIYPPWPGLGSSPWPESNSPCCGPPWWPLPTSVRHGQCQASQHFKSMLLHPNRKQI